MLQVETRENVVYHRVVHGANGYLIAQFLDNTSNHRTDEWGGSVENRARFGLAVIKALKEVYGDNIGLKVTPCGGYNDMGCVRLIFTVFISDVPIVCLCKKRWILSATSLVKLISLNWLTLYSFDTPRAWTLSLMVRP